MTQVTRLDEDGNIQVHGREGVDIDWQFLSSAGAPEDASTYALFFETNTGFRKALAAGATTSHRRLVLTSAEVTAMFGPGPRQWAVRDETVSPPEVIWGGTLRFFGWSAP